MPFSLLAALLTGAHLLFIVFVTAGGVLVLRWPRLAWVHLPCAAWGTYVEWSGRVCPLTPLENWLRRRAGEAGYPEGFIEHYLLALVYPAGLDRTFQLAVGAFVVAVNAGVYALLLRRRAGRIG